MIVEVQCYAGRKADERPVRFRIGDRDYMVEEIVEQRIGRMTASTKCVPTTTTCTCCVTRRVGTPGRLSRSRNLGESWAAIWTSRTKSQLAPGATPPMRCRARMYLRGSVPPVLPVSPARSKGANGRTTESVSLRRALVRSPSFLGAVTRRRPLQRGRLQIHCWRQTGTSTVGLFRVVDLTGPSPA